MSKVDHQVVPDFFLASSEGYGLEQPRACYRVQRVGGRRPADDYLIVDVEPPVDSRGSVSLSRVVLATRHDGETLFPISEWPIAVHVAKIVTDSTGREELSPTDLKSVGWAELYPTLLDAERLGRSGH